MAVKGREEVRCAVRVSGVNIDDDSKFQNDQNVEILNFRGCFEAVRGR